MRMNTGQLALPLRPARGNAASIAPPFPIAWRKIRRVPRRVLPGLNVPPSELLAAAQLVEAQALLVQIRQRARTEARAGGRMSKRQMIAYACKPEGRRVARVIARLSESIAAQEARLCG